MHSEDRIADVERQKQANRKPWHTPRLELMGQPAGGTLVGAEDGTYTPTS